MDIISHGLYGGVAFGRRSRRSYWLAFFFGIAPDLFSFGIFFADRILGLLSGGELPVGRPDATSIPAYVYHLYNVTHSLVVAAAVIGLVWLFIRRLPWEMLAWPLHILVDIPTHSSAFFPTPFLWPLSHFHVQGHSWGTPEIFIPNVLVLIALYSYWFFRRKRMLS